MPLSRCIIMKFQKMFSVLPLKVLLHIRRVTAINEGFYHSLTTDIPVQFIYCAKTGGTGKPLTGS